MALSLLTPWQSEAPLDRARARARLRGGQYPDAMVEAFLERLAQHADITGMALAPLCAQVCKETANLRFGGQVVPQQFNFAGIGSTNDGAAGHSFGSIDAGVMGLIAHHGNYLFGPFDRWPTAWEPYQALAIRNAQVLALTIDGVKIAGTVRTIGDFRNGVWAWTPTVPFGSLANGYARGIVEIGNTLLGGEPVTLQIREAIIPRQANRPGTKLDGGRPGGITIHETANTNVGANAEMHRKFLVNGGGPESVSFHYCVDDQEAVNLLPDDEEGHHAGDGLGAGSCGSTTIGIELCVNADGDWSKTRRNGAELVALLLKKHGLPASSIRQHFNCSGKNCPTKLRANNNAQWSGFLAGVNAAYALLTGTGGTTTVTPGQPDAISKALTTWYAALPADLRGDLGNANHYQANVDFSSLHPTIQGQQRAIFGEYLAAWFMTNGTIAPIFPRDRVRLEDAGKITRR